ncbi:hypothetical protein EXIGLDRAFT_720488 [Exidia glandulosa HHB12029]|uniref:Uncharacterized protein n=1 Tax=Exidia glandulosa HHB12029 TaxID=1314781 RepID=A0A165GD13_EXIGL|nr:hypothetical protein EXIGLDRAFT_720488 [Exidia glandulosa HHB12029]
MADHIVIREIAPGLRIYSKPFARFNIAPIGGRSTAVKLASGDVLVVASTPLSAATKKSVDELGPVKYLVALDSVHYLYLKEWKAAYSGAHVAGVPGSEKNAGVKHDGVWGRDSSPLGSGAAAEEFKSEWFEGHPNQDVALLHVPSKTLIQADLLFNLPAHEQYSAPGAPSPTSGLLGWFGLGDKMTPWTSTHQGVVFNMLGKDKAKMAYSASVVASWEFNRIIPCHGDVIEEKGNEAWRSAYKRYLDAIAQGTYKGYTPPSA